MDPFQEAVTYSETFREPIFMNLEDDTLIWIFGVYGWEK